MFSLIKVRDLVKWCEGDHEGTVGVVLKVISDVEIPSLIEVFWSGNFNSSITRVYADDLVVIDE